MAVEVVTPPSGTVVDLGTAKEHLNVPDAVTLFDDVILLKVASSTAYVEQILGRALLTQTWRLWLDTWPSAIRLPGGKPRSITSVKYTDVNGIVQTLDPTVYQTDPISEPARIVPVPRTQWPVLLGGVNQVQVEYVVGYGDPADVPQPIAQAILLHLGDAWINREAALDSRFYVQNVAVDNLIWPYRMVAP